MILGLGNDLVDIRRIEKTLRRSEERFLARVFTSWERDRALRRKESGIRAYASVLAKYFAAKEACSKALGTGISEGVSWQGMGVMSLPSGKPTMVLTEGAARKLVELTPPAMTAQIDLSLTDEYPYAHAVVIISAV